MTPVVRRPRLWTPKRVLVTRPAADLPHTAEILRRCEAAGVEDIELLPSNRLTGLTGANERETYARAKSTLAVVVAPPSAIKPVPIPPSADWRIDLAKGCPAHCQYCYLAGSLTGPPVTRVFANLDDVLAGIGTHVGLGSGFRAADRVHEGATFEVGSVAAEPTRSTTFELSCYTDPLGIEHVTGSLGAAITRVGSGEYGDEASLRFTTKFDDVDELVGLPHGGRTRMRVSVNAAEVERFEGGTAPMAARLEALRRMATAGYPVGLTIAPVMPVPDWPTAYGALLDAARTALADVPGLDLTVEIITHRFTAGSREVLLGWYPGTKLEMDTEQRSAKRNKFGGTKYVYPRETMTQMKGWFTEAVADRLAGARLLYWT